MQIVKNSESGTFSPWRFPVAMYASGRNSTESLGKLFGLDEKGNEHEGMDNNDDAFLKAVLRHLLNDGAAK